MYYLDKYLYVDQIPISDFKIPYINNLPMHLNELNRRDNEWPRVTLS